ncbi:DUF5999 family protein [Streptomyces sp. NPDC003077]|uniref:DUF5999 family protein n=1 Tax=Streptomyces sp. NPDC003077 TaxID=3154443 RepID=UPI0033AF10F2
MCRHIPRCPTTTSPHRRATKVTALFALQWWRLRSSSLALDGVGEPLPNGRIAVLHRPLAART